MYLFCRSYFVRVVAFVITLPARSSPLLSFWDMGDGGEIFRASNFDAHFAVGFFLLSLFLRDFVLYVVAASILFPGEGRTSPRSIN